MALLNLRVWGKRIEMAISPQQEAQLNRQALIRATTPEKLAAELIEKGARAEQQKGAA